MKQVTRQAFVFPNPVTMVTVPDGQGGSNIITLAWVGMACSDPVCVSIAVRPSRHSYELIKAAGEFCVNIPGEDLVRQTDICGSNSGRNVDKWELAGLTPEPSEHVASPRIAECHYSLECRVVHSVALGAHELFVAEVLGAYADDSILNVSGKVDYSLLRPMGYLPEEYWATGSKLYNYGQSKRQ
jgi:flavin reductase (DIM6/NTAB) family NADH-FMN oxidoreductase RutF